MNKKRIWAWAAATVVVVGMIAIMYLILPSDSTVASTAPSERTELPNLSSELAAILPTQADRLSKLYFLADFDDSEPPVVWLERFESGERVVVREQPNDRGMRLLALKVALHSRVGVAYVEYAGKLEEFRNDYVEDVLAQSSTLMPGEPEPAIPEGLTEPVMAVGLTDPVNFEGLGEPFYEDKLSDPSIPHQSEGF